MASPSLPDAHAAQAARLEEVYRNKVVPLVEEYLRVEADNSGRGKQFEKNKLAILDELYAKIKSVNDQFASDAEPVGLDSTYYVMKYSAGLGSGSSPSEKAAANREAKKRQKAEARWRRNSELSDQFLGCLYQTLATGCFLLVILAGLVMLFFATIMIMFI